MHFKYLLFLSFVFTQSYYESVIGITSSSYNARSLSMGSASQIIDRTSLSLNQNPSNISIESRNGFQLVSSYLGQCSFERRGIVIKDSFGDYLTDTDYVKNTNFFSSLAFGVSYSRNINNKLNLAIGFSLLPYKTFNYNYREEVRGSLSYTGPTSRDPLLGYHLLESKGTQSLTTYGLSLTYIINEIKISNGLSINYIGSATVNETVEIDTITTVEDFSGFFSDIIPYDINYKLKEDTFLVFGHSMQLGKYQISLSLQSASIIRKVFSDKDDINPEFLDESSNQIVSYNNLYDSNSILSTYLENHFSLKAADIENPEKYNIGFSIFNEETNGFDLIFNYELSKYNEDYILSSFNKFSLAIEHFTSENVPLRFGIEYSTSPFKPYVTSISSFTAGSGFSLNTFTLDFGIRYNQVQYSFPDLFPLIDNLFQDLDTINESSFKLMTTLSYKF